MVGWRLHISLNETYCTPTRPLSLFIDHCKSSVAYCQLLYSLLWCLLIPVGNYPLHELAPNCRCSSLPNMHPQDCPCWAALLFVWLLKLKRTNNSWMVNSFVNLTFVENWLASLFSNALCLPVYCYRRREVCNL